MPVLHSEQAIPLNQILKFILLILDCYFVSDLIPIQQSQVCFKLVLDFDFVEVVSLSFIAPQLVQNVPVVNRQDPDDVACLKFYSSGQLNDRNVTCLDGQLPFGVLESNIIVFFV